MDIERLVKLGEVAVKRYQKKFSMSMTTTFDKDNFFARFKVVVKSEFDSTLMLYTTEEEKLGILLKNTIGSSFFWSVDEGLDTKLLNLIEYVVSIPNVEVHNYASFIHKGKQHDCVTMVIRSIRDLNIAIPQYKTCVVYNICRGEQSFFTQDFKDSASDEYYLMKIAILD